MESYTAEQYSKTKYYHIFKLVYEKPSSNDAPVIEVEQPTAAAPQSEAPAQSEVPAQSNGSIIKQLKEEAGQQPEGE